MACIASVGVRVDTIACTAQSGAPVVDAGGDHQSRDEAGDDLQSRGVRAPDRDATAVGTGALDTVGV